MSHRSRLAGALIVSGYAFLGIRAVAMAVDAESPSALALLRGVESVRKPTLALKATLTSEFISPKRSDAVECVVECDGSKRRFEQRAARVTPGVIVIMDGDEFRGFRRKANEDVCVYSMRQAIGTRGDSCFDPRILGLSDLLLPDHTVKACLLYEHVRDLEVVGREQVNSVSAWRVKAMAKDVEYNYWIEEPPFRVHRKTVKWGRSSVDIRCEYDASDANAALPKRVHIKRVEPRRTLERRLTVTDIQWPPTIPPERFTLKSMDLPINTMINDYRIERIVGYWNGEGVSESPVYEGERPSGVLLGEPSGGGRRWLAFGLGILLLVIVLAFTLLRSRIARKPGTDSLSAEEEKGI